MSPKEAKDVAIWFFVIIVLIVIPIVIAKAQQNKAELKALQSETEFMEVMSDGGTHHHHKCYVCYEVE